MLWKRRVGDSHHGTDRTEPLELVSNSLICISMDNSDELSVWVDVTLFEGAAGSRGLSGAAGKGPLGCSKVGLAVTLGVAV